MISLPETLFSIYLVRVAFFLSRLSARPEAQQEAEGWLKMILIENCLRGSESADRMGICMGKRLSDVHNKAKSIQIGSLNHFSFSSHYYLFTHFLSPLFLLALCISIGTEGDVAVMEQRVTTAEPRTISFISDITKS